MTESIDQRLIAGLARIGVVLRHQSWKAGAESGLHPTQSQVLGLLHARGEGCGLAVSEVACELALTAATVSDSVSTLERKGLVARGKDAADGRIVRIRLTAEGSAAARRAAAWPEMLLSAVGSLSPEEKGVFVRGLIKMIRSLQQAGEIPVARMCPSCAYFRPHAHPGAIAPHHCAYVDAPLGDVDLRLDCGEYSEAAAAESPRLWQLFIDGKPPAARARAGGDQTPTGRARLSED